MAESGGGRGGGVVGKYSELKGLLSIAASAGLLVVAIVTWIIIRAAGGRDPPRKSATRNPSTSTLKRIRRKENASENL